MNCIQNKSHWKFLRINSRENSNHEIQFDSPLRGWDSDLILLEVGVVFNRRVRKSSEAPWPPRNPQTGVGASRAFNNPAYIWWTSNREVVAVPLNGAEPSTPSVGSHVHGRARAHARRARAHAAYTRTRRSTYTQTQRDLASCQAARTRSSSAVCSLAAAFIFPKNAAALRQLIVVVVQPTVKPVSDYQLCRSIWPLILIANP